MRNPRRGFTALLPILAVAMLAGCGSSGIGNILGGVLGGVLGGGGTQQGGNYPSGQSQDIRATVESVDTRGQRIELSYVNGRNSRATIYYDSRTRVAYQNRTYSPSDLERGDEVDIRLYNSRNNQAVADTITVTRSASQRGGTNNYPNNYPSNQSSDIEGTIEYVDDRSGRIELTNAYIDGRRTNQRTVTIEVDRQTRVLYQNRSFRVTDLERGDQVQVRLYNRNSNQYRADTITVTRSVRQ